MSLVDRVRRTIRRHNLVPAGARLVAAVSGGPDSVALVHLLRALQARGDLVLAGLAHLNHQLRLDADRDEACCRQLARDLSLPIIVERVDVRAYAASRHVSLEAAAHDVRYAFFGRARAGHGADAVALGHTADDQAETVLLRLTRGAGARGIGGMHPRVGAVVRPLLDCRRRELRTFLDSRGLAYVHDPSNDDVRIPRNRIRAELVPLLEARFNPRIVEALSRVAELSRDEQEYLDSAAAAYWDSHAREVESGWAIEATALAAEPVALQRRVLLHGLGVIVPGRCAEFAHVERARAVLGGDRAAVELPGSRLERRGGLLVLRSRLAPGRPGPSVPRAPFQYTLGIPGEVFVAEAGCTVSAEVHGQAGPEVLALPAQQAAVCPLALVRTGLVVRARRPGDRLRTERGGRKLQDVLVDRKVPRAARDRLPIVVDADDRIVWVPGHVVSQEFRVTDPAQAVVVLRLKGVGGSF